jgi:N-terminal domain of anti-restriction factor ArdC
MVTLRLRRARQFSTLPVGGRCRKALLLPDVWLLTMQSYTSPYWATIRQINELGGSVRRGEKSTPVVFWCVYVDGVELEAGEPEPKPEKQKARAGAGLFYGTIQFSTRNNAICRFRSPEKLTPEQRQLDPIEA